MPKKVRPEPHSGSGAANPAFQNVESAGNVLLTDSRPVRFANIIDQQMNVNEASKDWKSYVARKRIRNLTKTDSSLSVMKRLGTQGSNVLDADVGLEVDPFALKKELSFTQIPNGALTPQGEATAVKNEHKMNRKLIEHFVMLNKEPPETAEVDFEHLKNLLDKGADINCHDRYGQTVLHEAARLWHTDIAYFLIEQGADVKRSDKYGRTALHIAAAVDYEEMIELLLEKGADIEARTDKEYQTPLHFAARNDAVDACKILVKFGAEIEAEDYRQRTPLQVAAELDRSETARWLVEQHAVVGRCDDTGLSCMTHMITKMGPVANDALDTFHKTDRTNRRQYFYLNLLEHDIYANEDRPEIYEEGISGTLAKTPLQVIVSYKQLDIIMHPVILKMLELKWTKFGRVGAIRLLLVNLIYIILWTALAVGVPWQTRYEYILPGTDVWRIVIWVLAMLMTGYFVGVEIFEISMSRRKFKRWKEWRIANIERDIKFCHPKWPEEEHYLRREIDSLDDMIPAYFKDFWNFFDWTVYFLNFAVLVTHFINIFAYNETNRPSPCCGDVGCEETGNLIRSGNVTVKGSCDLPGAFVNNACLSVWVNRIFVLNILMMWLKLMKNMRSFRTLGPFVVMLGKIFYDILRFLFLYFEFYIPYACAFWMIFGDESSISSMSTVDQMLFSLYRITLVDDYQYDEMHAFDVVMTYILVGTFLGVSAILCINLFIALLSDTFQRVYDNANANAVMQQAIQILTIEENLSKPRRDAFRKFISEPIQEFYDDDLTTSQDDNLKKATIQIRDQMEEVLEHIRAEQKEKKELDDDMHDGPPRRFGRFGQGVRKMSSMRLGVAQLTTDMTTITNNITKHQAGQDKILKRMQRDIREIKLLLTQLVPDPDPNTRAISSRESESVQRAATPASMFEQPSFPLEIRTLPSFQPVHSRSSSFVSDRGPFPRDQGLRDELMARLVSSSQEARRSQRRSPRHMGEGLEMGNIPGTSDRSPPRDDQGLTPEFRLPSEQSPTVILSDPNVPENGSSNV